MCRVIEAFVGRLNRPSLALERAKPAETVRQFYYPRDLLEVRWYVYFQAVAGRRGDWSPSALAHVEVWAASPFWRGPDYKSIAEFRRMQ